ncbi:MAG: DUF669 domain-containing protein [Patescibacteria group bacterium]
MSNGDLFNLFGQNAFDPTAVEPQSDFEVIPPSKVPVLVESAEVKATKAGTGYFLKLTLSIIDGPYKGRKLFDNINLQNPSAQCVEIGLRQLSALGQAIGVQAISDSSQLVNKTCIAHVKVKDDQNYVRTYSSTAAAVNAPQQPPSAPAQAQGAPAGQQVNPAPAPQPTQQKPPWAR